MLDPGLEDCPHRTWIPGIPLASPHPFEDADESGGRDMTVELVSTAQPALPGGEFAALYAQAQRFYAHQMRLLDTHDTKRWAQTFAEDAVLRLPSLPAPAKARVALAGY